MANKKRSDGFELPHSAYTSPYMKNYVAARTGSKSGGKSVKMVQVGNRNPKPSREFMPNPVMDFGMGFDPGMVYNTDFGMGAEAGYKEESAVKPKRDRRFVPVLLIVIFTLLYIAVLGLSYLNMDALSDYNGYFAMYEGNPDSDALDSDSDVESKLEDVDAPEAEAAADEETDGTADEETDGTADEETNGEADEETDGTADEDVAAPETVKVGVEDLAMSFVALFVDSIDAGEYYMYNEFYADIENADTVTMIASYAMPVLLILGAVTALIFFIRALVALFTSKRRKLFVLSSVLMLVFTLLSAVCAYLMTAGTDFSYAMSFLTMDGTLPLQLGFGIIILAVLSLLSLIMSFFAFRKSRKLS